MDYMLFEIGLESVAEILSTVIAANGFQNALVGGIVGEFDALYFIIETSFSMTVEFLEALEALGLVPHGIDGCLLYTSPSPRDGLLSRMPSSA